MSKGNKLVTLLTYVPLITIPVVLGVFFLLMQYYTLPVSLGLISLTLTVVSGTTVVKTYFQYLKLPKMKKPADLILVSSIAVALVATGWGIFKDSLERYESITYAVLIVVLIGIMCFSAKKKR